MRLRLHAGQFVPGLRYRIVRLPPSFPPRPEPASPNNKRWLLISAALLSFSSAVIALLTPAEQRGLNTIAVSAVIMMLLLMAWLTRMLWYRCARHNSRFHQQLVEYEQQQWWSQHRQAFGLQDIILLGPAGTELQHWHRLLLREHRPPQPVLESSGQALRLPQIFSKSQTTREAQLARLLVMQWREHKADALLTSPTICFWLGTQDAWQAFIQQASATFPELSLPEYPECWLGEASLSAIAGKMPHLTAEQTILVAGCESHLATAGAALPAGEAAVLWLAGREGEVQLTRGEISDTGDADALSTACLRAMEQGEISEPPDACLLFSLLENDMPAASGWNLTHHIQDGNWGNTGSMEALVVMSLAALHTQQQGKPNGWIARDPVAGYTTGIVKTYG